MSIRALLTSPPLNITNPIQYKGAIALSTDFPLLAAVQIGWYFKILANVTDNAGGGRTNTGQSFLLGDDIVWNGASWDTVGSAVSAPTLAAVLAAGNSAGGSAITSLLDPVNPQDAVTKVYSDSTIINITQETHFTTIQLALDAAVPGDIIELGAGTHTVTTPLIWPAVNNITLRGKISESPIDVILSGGTTSQILEFAQDITGNIGHMTVKDGYDNLIGGGAFHVNGGGLGLGVLNILSGTIFRDNVADAVLGGAILLGDLDAATINFGKVIFFNNSAINFGSGGAVLVYPGAGIANYENCIGAYNSADGYGGFTYTISSTNMLNSTFFGNTATLGGSQDGFFDGGVSTVKNTIAYSGGDLLGTVLPTITYSNVKGHVGGTGNIDKDPQFRLSTIEDFYLMAGSPSIDTGTNTGAPTEDIVGTTRPQNVTVDMGAYEFIPANIYSGTYTPTLTNTTNIDASTPYLCQFMRVGSVVTVSGKVDIDATAVTSSTILGISLPITSNFGALEDCGGTGVSADASEVYSGAIEAIPSLSRVRLKFFTVTDVSNRLWAFSFTYRII